MTVLSAFASSYSLKLFLENAAIIPLALSVSFLVIFSCFEIFLIKSLARRSFILVLETLALLSFFFGESLQLLFVIGSVIAVFLFWGEALSRSEARNSLEIGFFRTVKPLVKKTITALSFLIVLLYVPQWSKGENLISKGWFESAAVSSARIAGSFYPELNFHSNVRELSLSLAKYELKGNDLFKNMPPSMQKQTLEQVTGQIIGNASAYANKYAGINLSGKESLGDVLYAVVDSTLENWRLSFGNWFLFAWAAALFLSIRSFGTLFWRAAAFLGFCAYELLIALNIFHIRGEAVTRETVEFS